MECGPEKEKELKHNISGRREFTTKVLITTHNDMMKNSNDGLKVRAFPFLPERRDC